MSDPLSSIDVTNHARETVWNGFFKIDRLKISHDLFKGGKSEEMVRELFRRGNSAAVLPWDPVTDRVLLIRQFLIGSHEAGRPNRPLQVIAGMVEPGHAAADTARREAMEEAGCALQDLLPAQAFLPSPGGSSEYIETFLAVCDLEGAGGHFGLVTEHEDIMAVAMPAREAVELLDAGEIEAGPAVVLLSWFARKHAELAARYQTPTGG